MIVQYRNFRFGNAAVEAVIDRQSVLDAAQNPWAYEERWRLRCWLDNVTASPATMAELLRKVENAFATPGGDVRLLLETGQPSHHALLNNRTIGGIRIVKPPSYPEGRGYQYGTYRIVDIELAALIPVGTRSNITSFVESVSFQGGGPRFGHLEPVVGFPIKQLLKQNTIWRAVQTGTAVGLFSYPTPPLPLWPDALVEPFGNPLQVGHPDRVGNRLVNFPLTWTYNFEAANKRLGRPNLWLS